MSQSEDYEDKMRVAYLLNLPSEGGPPNSCLVRDIIREPPPPPNPDDDEFRNNSIYR